MLGLKPAAELTAEDAAFIVQNFFHAQRQRMIEPYPRYRELLARRGSGAASDVHAAARRFSVDDLRDLQVWQKLAWIDPIYLEGDERVRALVAKDRDFTEEDKHVLRGIELELLNAVIPAYREAAARGQVELSTSPFYHPILPLLCDTDIYKRTHPDARMPRHRFVHPEDAREQLDRAVACHERLFGARPAGLWPSEGSVSDAMVPLVAAAGFQWMATDELILARTLGIAFGRDSAGHVDQPERLYQAVQRPRRRRAGSLPVPRSRAVGSDWVHLRRLERRRRRRRLRRPAGRGGPPLRGADRRGRSHHPDHPRRGERLGALRRRRAAVSARAVRAAVDASRAADRHDAGGVPRGRAPSSTASFPGSWIDANFYIWIGHRDDQLAWSQLAEARAAVETPQRRRGGRRAGPRGGAHRRRQRLVLVVRRRSLVGARPGIRRPVQAAPPKRLSAARQADSRRALRQQHLRRSAAAR